jgi:hypothetical protein
VPTKGRVSRPAGRAGWLAVLLVPAAGAAAQPLVSDLEPERPIAVEDARPVPYRAFVGAVDWTYSIRSKEGFDDTGPGFSLLYGAARRLEVGSALRYVTRPGRNALRGISSGDLEVHALYALVTESARWPGIAVRLGAQFPTGLDSRGTDLVLTGLLTRSFDAFRLHANLRWTRLGDTLPVERADRLEAAAGVDFLPSRRGSTDTVLLVGGIVRSSPLRRSEAILELETGFRHRIGLQTVFFGGLGSEVTGQPDRVRLRLRTGISRVF